MMQIRFHFGLLVFLFTLWNCGPLHAATFYVTNLNNSGAGSFRQACSDADGNGVGIDTVDFTVSGTITLSSAVTVNSNVYIRGLGPDQNILQANATAGTASYRVLDFGANADLVYVVGVRVRHGNVAANGGGINSAGNILNIENCVIDSNYCTGNQGGGVFTAYSLTMKNCLVRGNYCQYNAGGVGHTDGSASSTLTFTNVTFAGNRSNSNQANHGGGAFLSYAFSGTHVINFMNCTFKDNYITGTYTNQGTAIHIQPFSTANYTLNIVNTLLQNTAGSNYYLYAGGGGFTLNRSYTISNDASMAVTGTGNSNSTNASLSALANNGGSQKTFAIGSGSPAYNAGTSSGAPSDDARGYIRVGNPDVGSYEFGAAPPYVAPDRAGSGYALEFDGTDDQALDASPGFNIDNSSFTIEFWCRRSTINTGDYILSHGITSNYLGLHIGFRNTNEFTFDFYNDYLDISGVSDANWHHWAATYNAVSNARNIYRDGLLVASDSPSADYQGTGILYIGSAWGGNNFAGDIDEIRVWQTDLDSIQIREWMCKKLTSSHDSIASLVAHYDFDDGTGTTLYDRVDTNHATLTNMATSAWVQSGAALGDESSFTYGGSAASLMNANGTEMNIDNFNGGFQGIHIYSIEDSPNNTNGFNDADTSGYFGIFKTGAGSYDVTLEYSTNTGINGQSNEQEARIYKRSNNSSANWELTTGELRTRTGTNRLLLPNQTGTEYVVGFANTGYPARPGSGYALEFDNVNDHVLVPDNSAFDISAVTIETWVYWQGASTDIDFICGKTYEEIEIQTQGTNKIRFIPTTDVYLDAPNNSFLPNRWNHVACVYDPSTSYAKIYINGLDVGFTNAGANPLSTALQTSAADFRLGMRLGGIYHFNGKMDEYRLWSTALDSTTIRNWMCKKVDSTHTAFNDMVAYYRFDEGAGSTLEDLVGGLDGTLTSMDTANAWEISGAALGDASANTYSGSNLSLQEAGGDSILINNFDGSLNGIHLYAVNDRPFYRNFYGAESTDTNYYFGVFKVGHDTATYDVSYYYGNSALLSGSASEYRVGLAKRDNNSDLSWESAWFDGTTNASGNSVFLPNQSGTEYAGIVSANNALDMDGVNDVVQVASTASLNNYGTTGELSIEYWVYPRSTATQQNHISKRPAANNAGFVLETNGDSLSGYVHYATWTAVAMQLDMNQWNHIALVAKNGAGVWIYKNGVLEDFTANAGNMLTTTYQLEIGAGVFGRYTNGIFDEVRIWDRALCQSEIQDHMACEFDTAQSGLAAFYSFNQGVADSVNTGLDSLIDQSENNQHGTLVSMSLSGTGSNWTAGSTGITGVCSPYLPPVVYVISEGDTIINGDSIANVADSSYFGDVTVGIPTTVTFEIYNGGVGLLTIDSVYFTGSDSADFSAVYSASVPAGDTGLITVTILATNADSIGAFLHLNSNDCGSSPYTFAIGGFVNDLAGALNFDGVNDYVNITDTLGYVGMNELTVEAWIKVEASTGTLQAIMSATGTEFFHFQVSPNPGNNNVVYTNNGILNLPNLPDSIFGIWRHVALVAKSGESRLFVDGSQFGATVTTSFDSIYPTNNIRIGSGFTSARFFDGAIDELRLWGRALDSTEIQANLHCELEGTECGLLAYYNFNSDSAIANSNNSGFTVLGDSSGNGHNGTLTNFALVADSSNWAQQSDSILNRCILNPDVVGPIVIPIDTLNVWVNSAGVASIDSSLADSASCDYYSGIFARWTVPNTVNCSNDGDSIKLFVRDNAGNIDSAYFVVNIIDTAAPAIITRTAFVYLNNAGYALLEIDSVDDGSFDGCSTINLSINLDSFTCADLTTLNDPILDANSPSVVLYSSGTSAQTFVPTVSGVLYDASFYLRKTNVGTVTRTMELIAGDPNSGTVLSSQTFSLANSAGTLYNFTFNDPVYLIAGDTYSFKFPDLTNVTQGAGYATSGANGPYPDGVRWSGTGTMVTNPTQDLYFVTNIRTANNIQQVILTATDTFSNSSSDTALVLVLDTVSPTAVAANHTAYLDATGMIVVVADSFEAGSTDNCAIDSIAINVDTLYCVDTSAAINVQFTAFDESGNSNTVNALILVVDSTPPTIATQNITINLDASGNATTTASAVNNGTTDNCAIDMIWLSDSTFTCVDSGANVVTFFARDISGNISSGSATITVQDVLVPTVVTQNITINLDATGNVITSAAAVDNGSTDNCAIDMIWLSDSTFTCADSGANAVTLFVRDISGNIGSAAATITVQDITAPNAVAQDLSVTLDGAGNVSITPAGVNNGSTDNCAINQLLLDVTTFSCADTGVNVVVLTVVDVSGNIDTAHAYITVSDVSAPTIATQNITINLDASGNATTTASAVNNGTTDNCAIDMIWLSDSTFTCADSGANTVTFFARDISGNISSGSATITVQDVLVPTAVTQNITINLDATGNVITSASAVNNGSTDNCAINQLLLDVTTFSCADTGVNVVVLTVVDVSGNIDTAHAYITVSDVSAPTIATQNITINLDASGNATTTASAVNNGTSDNCAIDMIWLSDSTFTCTDSGANTVTFFARDISGNISSSSATVTVQDIIPPTANVTDLTVYLGITGNATLTGAAFNVGSTDNCAVASHSTSVSSFNCTHIGSPVNVVITAYDVSGNSDTAHATVTVLDTIAPTVVTQNVSINLNASGLASITAASVNNGSNDACGIATVVVDSTNFNCSEVGANTVTLTVTDIYGNVGTGTATVTVIDAINPVAIAKNYYTVFLDSFGNAALAADSIDSASSDNCTFSKTLSVSNFTCVDAGFFTPVTMTITDASGNIATDVCQVFVDDTIPPIPFTQNISVNLDATGNVGVSVYQVLLSLSDTCAIVEILVDSADSVFFDCSNTGTPIQVLVSARDTNNNIGSNLATITVVDNIDPTVVTRNLTIFLDSNGSATIDSNALDSASFDVCGIASINNSQSVFDCTDLGVNNITVTVTDVNGNPSTAVAQVTVFDTISPVAGVYQNVVRYLNAAGTINIPTNTVRNPATSNDNCSYTSQRTPTNANCSNVGTPLLVVVTVEDPSGNSDTAHTYVTILDTVRPNGITQNITIQLDSSGNDTITWSQINNGSTDACGIDSIWLSDSIFNCADIGANTIQMYVRDIWNNTDTVNATVTVQDIIDPVLFTVSDTIYLDSDGDANTTVASILDSVSDACGIASIVPSDTTFTCSDVGTNVITLTVTDNNGNVTVNNVNIVVFDTIFPTILIINATVYLDASGAFTLDSSVIELGTFDNCAIPTYSIDSINYDCINAYDTIMVHVTVTDEHGNASVDSVQIIILDTVRPAGIAQNFTTQLNAFGIDTISWTNIENGSTDACGIDSAWLSDSIFNCNDVGANAIQMFVRDVNGNIDTVGAVVTVQDLVPPTAIAHQVVNIYLDSFGAVSITETDIDSASADACGIDTMIISQYDFICSDVGAPIAVVLTVIDVNGNVSLDTALVNVFDTIAPLVFSQNDTVYLDSFGQVSITENDINNGSWDSCGIATVSIDTFNFSCENTTSLVPVVLTITDVYGNSDTAHATVLVIDSIRPEIVCQADILVDNDPNLCGAIVTYPMASATDNCAIDTVYQQDTTGLISGSLFPVGTTTVMFMAVDVNGNLDSCTLNITVIDTQPPTIICHSDTVICDSVFNFTDPVTADNCSGETLVQTGGLASGSSYPVGITVNTFIVTDASGNTDSCSFTVTRDPFPDAALAGGDTVMCNILSYSTSATPVTIGAGSWSVLSSNATILDTADATTQFDGLDIGDNEFLWTVRSGVCALNYDTLMIKLDEFSTIATLPGDTSLCAQNELVVVGNIPSAGVGTWSISGPANLSSTVEITNSVIDMQIGSIQVVWTISNGICPAESDSMWIYNNALPTVDVGDNFDRFPGQTVTMQPIVTNAVSYLWTPSELFVDPEVLNAEVSTMNSVMLKLTATSDSGCVSSDSVFYFVSTLDSLPTGITPNGDNINDVWNLKALVDYPNAEVSIYDQTGRIIFQSQGYAEPFDGNVDGVPLPRASYYYVIDLKDGINQPFKGIITIIR